MLTQAQISSLQYEAVNYTMSTIQYSSEYYTMAESAIAQPTWMHASILSKDLFASRKDSPGRKGNEILSPSS